MSESSPILDRKLEMEIQLLSEKATLPTQGSAYAAGMDLYSAEDKTIPARGRALIDLRLSIAVPAEHYGRIAPRSGLASKHGIQTGAGVIDSDYRGPVMVLLFNHSDVEFEVKHGDRIAQLILERISLPALRQVDTLPTTVRGAGGFGSTGGFGTAAKKHKLDHEAEPIS
ncbi:hypothetical protein L202_05012 [Cryptococcus amylolentus CBS 6039]|uniref:Deoxyuridine 5'-triphosphate nucleotidohydrolase n=2 Tax=Cryptococcus amylolentus TaxID=104669 RepID=A0A1E3HQB4_9TREE|nr:hypothetical protein L202_05012 [Cryptococcus amylolentus CBS 6039]ODN77906.1 hypothetical protein L202_05012 [Cryptococcus amylolentus CBS 6039]ODO05875.1 hypothetical protein I350_04936 [Cryptococcus amylolentus CBS 6273]